MFNLLEGSPVNRGQTPQNSCFKHSVFVAHFPSCTKLAVLLGQREQHICTVFPRATTLGTHMPRAAWRTGALDQESRDITESSATDLITPSRTQMISMVPSGSLKLLMPTMKGAHTKGEGF